jgi:hypothetical protein
MNQHLNCGWNINLDFMARFGVCCAQDFHDFIYCSHAITQMPDERACLVAMDDNIASRVEQNDLAIQRFDLKTVNR